MTATRRTGHCIAVVGPGDDAAAEAVGDAEALGRSLAERGWITLCGGRAAGVMAGVARGVSSAGGIVIGLLPGTDRSDAAPGLTAALPTGLGEARDAVLVTAADAVIGCGLSPGTVAELALALRAGKPTALVRPTREAAAFFQALAGHDEPIHVAATPREAVEWVAHQLTPEAPGG
ncbi:MAG TPA: hypothetical protein VF041_02575 [Gemmatimonadaceae bacterium]